MKETKTNNNTKTKKRKMNSPEAVRVVVLYICILGNMVSYQKEVGTQQQNGAALQYNISKFFSVLKLATAIDY